MDDVLTLISQEITQDENGVEHATQTARDVFCRTSSIGQSEFFKGGRAGLNPAYRFTVAAVDYNGEALCRYRGEPLAIYRTYKGNAATATGSNLRSQQELGLDYVQLYAQREGGSNGAA